MYVLLKFCFNPSHHPLPPPLLFLKIFNFSFSFFTDPKKNTPAAVSPTERKALWHSAVTTLAKFHAVDFRAPALNLSTFGKPSGFYSRQLLTWKAICDAQAQATDVDTHKPVGPLHPDFDALIDFFADTAQQPRDRATLVHGDFKIDNLMFHPTEPRVIGILDWEMSTVGHPLSDVVNLLNPFYMAVQMDSPRNSDLSFPHFQNADVFLPGRTPGLPTAEEALAWYVEGGKGVYDPRPDLGWGNAFHMFRSAGILQGIAARVARRQASSEFAAKYAGSFKALGELAWRLTEDEKAKRKTKGKL